MKKITLLLFVFFTINAYSQSNDVTQSLINSSGGYTNVLHIPVRPAEMVGSVYYNDVWHIGIINFFDGRKIKGYGLKYDIKSQYVEIKTDNGIKVLPVGLIENITWRDVNGKEETLINWSSIEVSQTGFYSVIYDGEKSVIKKIGLQIIDSNYNAMLDVGNKDNKYTQKNDYFFIENGKVKKTRKKKKEVLNFLADRKDQISNYAKENNLKYSSDDDLKKIFNYYNSL